MAADQGRSTSLRQLKLKTVIKESHCSPVQQLDVNLCDASCRNLFATVGKDQATIYDDMHMGDNVAVVGNLALSNTPEDAKDTFHACCWIKTGSLSRHPYGDALLAVGGSDPCVHIISIVEAAVVGQLPIPAGTSVAELCAASECPGLLLVLCRDGSMQLWQVASGSCLWSCKTDAFAATLHPDGSCVLSIGRTGYKISKWDLQGLDTSVGGGSGDGLTAAAAAAAGPGNNGSAAAAVVAKQAWLMGDSSDSGMDCIRFLTGNLVATKTPDGYMAVHSYPAGKCVSSWKVPGCGSNSTPSYSKRCYFGATKDGRFLAVGNNNACAYVYDTSTGRQLTRVEAIRVQGAVRSCGLSECCRHLVIVAGHGYVFRYEARAPVEVEVAAEEEEEEEEQQQQELEEAVDEEPELSGSSDVEMPDAADAADAPPAQQQHGGQQQQQSQWQQRADGTPPLGGARPPASLAGIVAPPAVDATPLGGMLQAASSSGSQQRDSLGGYLPGLPRDSLTGLPQPASATAAAGGSAGVDDSPLVFRPTPRKL